MSLIASVEKLEQVASTSHQDAIIYCLRNSVPHGGVSEDLVPANLSDAFTDLIAEGLITSIVDSQNSKMIFVPTLRAMFILSPAQYADCMSTIDVEWDKVEKTSNVRCLAYGIIPQRRVKKG